jgi:hypothetical protein
VACSIASSNRSVSDVCREYLVSWGTAHKGLFRFKGGVVAGKVLVAWSC